MRITAFVANTRRGQLPHLELGHRRRARCEDRIRIAKETGLRNLSLHGYAANQIWCAIVTLACDLLAWMGMLALTSHDARRWEPKRLRLRLFTIPASIARTARRVVLHLSDRAPWASVAVDAISRLDQLRAPADPATRRPDQPHHPDPWNPHPVTTTGQLSHPPDRISPTR